ncbi:response regulator [Arenibacter sp. 6A1]|uniref:response regulator n=1 Tax=Arenibacter sp. 6A1 TaxID=2720391 RepID=UPI00293BE840|nr:response regulator [Arenibacter sp. 6A1]
MMNNGHILLVEDNEGDILLTKEALEEVKPIKKLSVVKNGLEALDFVFQRGKYRSTPLPDLILLDINLPIKNGYEVLQAIKSDEKTMHIPVIILTTSSSQSDIDLSYYHQADCYLTKPVEMESFSVVVNAIELFLDPV